MKMAAELAKKFDAHLRPDIQAAINEAIERCGAVAGQYAEESGYAYEIAQEIRELKG